MSDQDEYQNLLGDVFEPWRPAIRKLEERIKTLEEAVGMLLSKDLPSEPPRFPGAPTIEDVRNQVAKDLARATGQVHWIDSLGTKHPL